MGMRTSAKTQFPNRKLAKRGITIKRLDTHEFTQLNLQALSPSFKMGVLDRQKSPQWATTWKASNADVALNSEPRF